MSTKYAFVTSILSLSCANLGLLPFDEEINFSVTIPKATSVFVVRPGEANEEYEKVCPLVKSAEDADTWEGSIKTGINTGDLQLAVMYDDADNPQGLLKFEVGDYTTT